MLKAIGGLVKALTGIFVGLIFWSIKDGSGVRESRRSSK